MFYSWIVVARVEPMLMIRWLRILLWLVGLIAVSPGAAEGNAIRGSDSASKFERLVLVPDEAARSHRRTGGFVIFKRAAPTFNLRVRAHGLRRNEAYTLIYFPDPWPGEQLLCLATGNSNRGGGLQISKRVNLNTSLPAVHDANHPTGARLRLVLTADIDCDGRRFRDWNPRAYLYETRLIRYTDTDVVTDYSGTWCLSSDEPGSQLLLTMVLEQTGNLLHANVEGFVVDGRLSDSTAELIGPGPDGLSFIFVITFDPDDETLNGTATAGSDVFDFTGRRGPCTDYEEPAGDPQCILPVALPDLVISGQRFDPNHAEFPHDGLDFGFDTPLPDIIAPCGGVIFGIQRSTISLGNIIYTVNVRYNAQWSYFIAFEPYSPDETIAADQQAQLAVTLGQVLEPGDVIGRLVVPAAPPTDFPHIHWGLDHNVDGTREAVCPRDVLLPEAIAEVDALYAGLGFSPVCVPPPAAP